MHPYIVEDQSADPVRHTDAWAAFLNARFAKRKELYENFSGREKEIIRKELRRIRYLREYFGGHRLSPSDRFPLVALLEQSHLDWREYATRRCMEELPRCEVEIARASGQQRQKLNRDRLIFKQVQQWPTEQYADIQRSVAPDIYIAGLDAVDDSVDDDPRKSDYGYNGWLMAFKKHQGGVTLNHPLCHGEFPHQKIAMQKLLYDKQNTPLRRSTDKTQLRYFHLQANNMRWVQDAIARYYGEDATEFDVLRSSHQNRFNQASVSRAQSNTERLLTRELWHGQERAGGDTRMPPHSRQIRPRCAVVPSPPWNTPGSLEGGGNQARPNDDTGDVQSSPRCRDLVLFMPYLHWEVEKRLVRMTNVIRKTRQAYDRESALERLNKRRGTWTSVVERAKAQARRTGTTSSDVGEWHEDSPSWQPQSPLGKYLWRASKLFQLIDEAADWRLISEHLYTQSPLHPRRTLEQYRCWTAEDTTQRDRQQVVYRVRRMRNDLEAIPRVVMVDQLWLWILDENTIITAFPRRWGRNKPDPSAVHRVIRDRLGVIEGSQISSIYTIALTIIDECSKIFFDRTKPDLRPEVVDMYGSAISNISEKKSEAYERFGRDVKRMNAQDPLQTAEELLRKSLSIKYEWSVLMEAQNVIDQLQIMQEIFTQQITVIGDFEKALRTSMSVEQWDEFRDAAEDASLLITEMKLRRDELSELESRQANTRGQLRELLDIKQQQSGIIEAKAAIRRADESVTQGRYIVVFTVVTIFFLPLSFLATLFGMNAQELNGSTMALSTQLMWMFVLSSIIIGASLAIAFSTWARTAVLSTFRGVFDFFSGRLQSRTVDTNQLHGASPQAIREFMISKQKEWSARDNTNGVATGSLPLYEDPAEKRMLTGLAHLWRQKPRAAV